MIGEMQASVKKQSGMATLVPPHFSNTSTCLNANVSQHKGGVNSYIAVDEVDIDFGNVLKPEKKAQTIKLRNISKKLLQEIGREPTVEETAQAAGLSVEETHQERWTKPPPPS